MIELASVGQAVLNMHRDLERLGECKKLLASPGLVQAFRDLLKKRAVYVRDFEPVPMPTATLYFKGVPVVECEHLQDLEYAFVK